MMATELIWDENLDLSEPAKLIGKRLLFRNKDEAWRTLGVLKERGFTAYYTAPKSNHCVLVTDYLPPATRDSDGFFIEDDALAARIRRELGQEPYCRQDDSIFPLLLTEKQRNDNEDVIGFIPGKAEMPGYHQGNMHLPSKILWYSNFETCIQKVISDFDIYGMGYIVSWIQWREMKKIADEHGIYASGVAEEIDGWLQSASDSDEPAMTIMCI